MVCAFVSALYTAYKLFSTGGNSDEVFDLNIWDLYWMNDGDFLLNESRWSDLALFVFVSLSIASSNQLRIVCPLGKKIDLYDLNC